MTEITQTALSADHLDEIIATIAKASEQARPLFIRGGNSKRHILGRDCAQELPELDISVHSGVIDYQPGELVITARAGTPLADIDSVLRQENQRLACEPPQFNGAATLGGTLACNLSGPARPWSGSIRDHVLGVQLINGNAEKLDFGGRVMKNVAGYDVSRLQAGALGTLGVITQVSIKVMPASEHELTLCFEVPSDLAIATMNTRAGEPKPLTGACWFDGKLYLRLAGAEAAVAHTASQWGGEIVDPQATPWTALREFALPYFAGEEPLWRFSHSATSPVQELGPTLIDWGGAQRWVRGEQDFEALQRVANAAGGHVSLFRGGDRSGEVRSVLSAAEQNLQQRLKTAFDPKGILNPGRLYSWL